MIQSYHARRILGKVFIYILLAVALTFFVAPFLWLLSTSVKDNIEAFDIPPRLIPKHFEWSNYQQAVSKIPFLTYTKNSLIITGGCLIGGVLSSCMVGYSISKVRWKGRNIIFALVIALMMIPSQVTMIPLYMVYNEIGWIDTYFPLIISYWVGPSFFVFLVRQFFLGIPDQLLDSARIDGSNEWCILWRIVLPISKGVVATVCVFTFLWTWSDFMGPLLYLNSEEMRTLSLGLTIFVSEHSVDWGPLMAAATIFIAPVLVLFFLAQKQFIGSIKISGFK